ncbi:MAG TPA: hypothetical protein VFF40_03230 [Acidimicrobiia bacterium]|nr:hypothetical protein [Acidimicrobiia bacterium]
MSTSRGPTRRTGAAKASRRATQAAVGSAAFAWSMLLLGGTAQADAPPDPPSDPNPSGDSLWIPASPPPEADATTFESAPAESVSETPAESAEPAESAAAPSPTPAGPPDQSTQTVEIANEGTAVGTTGSNTAIGNSAAGENQADECPTGGTQITLICTATPTGAAGVASGNADANGSLSDSGITQVTNIVANADGQVDILQVALIINIGVGMANSGQNTAGAAGGPSLGAAGTASVGTASIGTGIVNVTGLLADTQVVQGVTIVSGSASDQSVTVLNIGIGYGNSGTNLSVGSVLGDGTQEVAAGGAPGSGEAAIGTGGAGALGDRSGSLIMQIVTVTANENGSITVTQRAVIVNFGLALANSGGNIAASALSAAPAAQRSVIEDLIAALFGLDPATLFGGGSAAIDTGTASATGNQSQSSILQQVTGSVGGDASATSDQSAWIGNFGAALANSGVNGAAGTLAVLPDGSPMANAEAMVARFLQLLTNPEGLVPGNSELSSALDLGSALLDVQGNIGMTEILAGFDESAAFGATDGGVRIRQVTGVLNIAIALADSGNNLAVSNVTGTNTTGGSVTALDAVASQVLGRATILTGTVNVVGEQARVTVCQIRGDDDSICPRDEVNPPAETESGGGPFVEAAVAATGAPATVSTVVKPNTVQTNPAQTNAAQTGLPTTGAPISLQVLLGVAATGGGMVLRRAGRQSGRRDLRTT